MEGGREGGRIEGTIRIRRRGQEGGRMNEATQLSKRTGNTQCVSIKEMRKGREGQKEEDGGGGREGNREKKGGKEEEKNAERKNEEGLGGRARAQ